MEYNLLCGFINVMQFFHLSSDNEEEGIWRNYYTGKEINSYNYNTAKLSEGYKGNCALFVPVFQSKVAQNLRPLVRDVANAGSLN